MIFLVGSMPGDILVRSEYTNANDMKRRDHDCRLCATGTVGVASDKSHFPSLLVRGYRIVRCNTTKNSNLIP